MKREIIITLALVALVILLASGIRSIFGTVDEGDAKNFVIEDLRSKYPDADRIEIISSPAQTNEKGETYFAIKGSVSYGLATPCPNRTYYYYNYPVQNFVPAPPEVIVTGCQVCSSPPCIILFEEEAIIASHTLKGTEDVENYMHIAGNAIPLATKIPEGWEVAWKSSTMNYSYSVELGVNGSVLEVRRL